MTVLAWQASNLAFAGTQRVYVKQRWADEWTLQPNIWCSDCNWALLPTIPTAQLSLEYGEVLPHGSLSWATQAKLNLAGWFVKIEIDAADGMLVWTGFIDEVVDEQGGITAGIPSGTLRWVAYGIVQVLAHAYFTRSRWLEGPTGEGRWSGSAIAFNANGKPNRSETIPPNEDTHIFSPHVPKTSFYVQAWEQPVFWTTKTICEYIQYYGGPTDNEGESQILLEFDNLIALPDWDNPSIETEGRSVLDVLNQLVGPSRLLQLSASVIENGEKDILRLTVHSLAESELTLNGQTHPANLSPISLVTWAAQDTQVTVQQSLSRQAAQVVAKGARRMSVVSVQCDATEGGNKGLVNSWLVSEAEEYNAGASNESSYSGMTTEEKQQANQRVRAKPKYADVYRVLQINPTWDFTIDGDFVFSTGENDSESYAPWWGDLKISDRLPLKEAFDYDSAVLISGPFARLTFEDDGIPEMRKPYIVFERPGEEKYIQAEKMANGEDPIFACYVGLSKENQAIALDVTGGYQHAIAFEQFEPLPVDDEDYGEWDYRDAWYTIALIDDRFLEASYPPDSAVPEVDVVRRKLLYAGDAYRRITILPNTVYEVAMDGSLQYVNGGASVPKYKDDSQALSAVAELVGRWVTQTRQILRLTSARPSAIAQVGRLVTTINTGTPQAATINTVISEISVRMDRGVNLPNNTAQFSLTTASAELDPFAIFPQQTVVTT